MTSPLAHPAAEDLGRFVEGTLDDAGRTAVVTHIADCDECRIVVVDTAEFVEQAAAAVHWHWWIGAAAAILLIGMGTLTNPEYRNKAIGWLLSQFNPLAEVQESYGDLKERPIDGRLSGFRYRPRKVTRGSSDEPDLALDIMRGRAASVAELPGSNPKTLHARGVAVLLEGNANESLAPLTAAAVREPMNAGYQNDLAAALITVGQRDPVKLQQALVAANRAVQLDPRALEALFNRGEALELLGRRKEAIAAYEYYLRVGPTSPGADEVRTHLELLLPEP